jgi:putative membrane protein
MRRQLRHGLLTAALLGGAMSVAQADVSQADRDFIEKAAMSGHEEVASGQTAAQSKNQAVADFGNQMVREHTQMNDELVGIAKRKGVEPPSSASLTEQAKGAVMSVLPGATFDKQYVSQQLSDHQTTLTLLQNQASSGTDPDLKAFAQKHIPVVEKHIAELQALQKQPELQ